jgi:DNA-binding transcriptional LysR family regulator
VNPSSVSRSIKKLEHEAGVSLFRPEGRKLQLTQEGKDLYTFGKRTLDDFSVFLKSLKQKNMAKDTLRLSTFEIFSTYFVAHLAQDFLPDTNFHVNEKVPQKIEEALLSKESDFGITYVPFLHPDLEHLAIAKNDVRVFAKKGSFKNLKSYEIPFSTPQTPLALNIPGLDFLDGWPQSVERNSKYSYHQLQSAIETTRSGQSAIYIPAFLAKLINEKSAPEYHLVDITERFEKLKKNTLTIYLVKRREDEENQLMKRVARAIRMTMK